MRTIRRVDRVPLAIGLLILLVSLLLAACGGSTSSVLSPIGERAGNEEPGTGSGSGNGLAAAPTTGPQEPDGVGAVDDAKIIRTGTMELEVTDLARAITAARSAILAMGGYIGASNTSNVDEKPYAEITYRIPVDRWEAALEALRGLNGLTSKVVAEQTQAVDVTGQVVDLEARIRNLRASETALQGIAERATRIPDILEIQAQITTVRGQIEQLEAQRNDLGDRTSYATLTTTFQLPVVAAIEVQAKGWDPGAIFDEASASLVGMLQGLAGAGIWLLVVWVPILVIVSIVIALAAWILRRTGVLERAMRPVPPAITGD